MVTGGVCCVVALIFSIAISTTLSTTAPPTPHPDEGVASEEGVVGMMKRLPGPPPQMSALRYLLMAMSNSSPRYTHPQLLNRGVRRMGSEFLGKRASPSPLSPYQGQEEDEHQEEEDEDCAHDELCDNHHSTEDEDLKKEHLSFTGQFDYNGEDSLQESREAASDHATVTFPAAKTKRMMMGSVHPWDSADFSSFFPIYLPRDVASDFLRKRMGSEFLGKRAMGSEFLGKRAMGSEFLGKRAMGSEFLGKRAMGSEFLGKRAMGSEFLGKRAMGSEFLGKRAMGSEFLGKRAMGSEFLGKRAMGSEFLGKRAMGSEFLGKRAMGSEFLGKRAMGSEFLGKRAMGSEFLDPRGYGTLRYSEAKQTKLPSSSTDYTSRKQYLQSYSKAP
ncbi:hypothetical protein Pcinc_033153 [Petrolisthes cinctipes]|uniref:Uncharacterized protein n=1 Tax=Petrolisthes cinctipes TaxID=88211 RepID=A0AAE1K1X6_PETCI|nr:hypothetical protein Pcinc_033153 [Petrolisthes cinctipes]